ncbi:protein EARLY FLOWERING 3-like [Durio zibethinus]|uniref:Protein EARLY FLOWERING 3-like n=1 Tax=Durio zibethinus TaxID=66656 RepID=A0A6P5ZPD7_DURZI|nr:protein EARLY FLOWERING 3-like [Durio zibethinus]XP_022754644.1 protein EARLY FLOWERING 3-like [Durio zibethinus]
MKRGKDDEKIMGPMFPRLHVNDTEKGGPRAPPRNKMALYEHLSIPSQRFNPGVLPLNPSNTSSLVPPRSSSEGSSLERNMLFPSHVSPSTSTTLAEKFHTRQLGGASANGPVSRLERRRKVRLRDEDDFMVPVFVNSETGQERNKTKNGFDGEKLTSLSPIDPGHQIKLHNVCDMDPNQSSSSVVNLRKEVKDPSEESSKVCSSRKCSVKTAAELANRENIDGRVKEANVSPDQDCGQHPASRPSRSHVNDVCSLQELRAGRQLADNGCIDGADFMIDIGGEILPRQRSMSYSEGNHSVPGETNNGSECREDRTCRALPLANGDKSDDVSETLVVDSISGLDISPDDMVGIIGQKHFWKARRAIVNQQRVFAVQVFELHRLIKVQRQIAGSPHLLLEDMTYLGKPCSKGSPAKKLPPEFIVKPQSHTKCKDDSEKPSHKMECSAENVVGRTSLSSVTNGIQPSNYGPFFGNQPPAPINGDNKISPWCFHQVPGHQWLVPVMPPSEGLIYKPFPGPGFMGSICGGCGPFRQTPMTTNFMTSYGVPAPSHQGIGVLPGAPPVGYTYFPPYGMPVMNPAVSGSAMKQMNQFAGPGSHAHSGQLSGVGVNFNMQHQSSCNLSSEENGGISHVMKFQASKDAELQGSTTSSPAEKVEGDGASSAAEGKNALPLFHTAPTTPKGASQPHDTNQRTRVIKVVPHNPLSASESAARIFQSIQKERKKNGV